jgi:hypothetical protein
MTAALTAKSLLGRLSAKDRILLVNPPVEETRYSWIRWNQPLDLLKIASLLRVELGCGVDFFDFMKPETSGSVRAQRLRGARQYRVVRAERYPMWHFGQPYNALRDWVFDRRGAGNWKEPTEVWITSLCSYWFESVAQACRSARQALPNARIVLLGQYPMLMPEHAVKQSGADVVVSDGLPLGKYPAAIDLYGRERPLFLGLQETSSCLTDEMETGVKSGIVNFCFFQDRLCADGGQILEKAADVAEKLSKRIRFHVICGLQPRDVTTRVASTLARPLFEEIHFEEETAPEGLDLEAYRSARAYLIEAGCKIPGRALSGFVWIGRPGDNLKVLLSRAFAAVELMGSIILKPFTPTPNGAEHCRYAEYLKSIPHQDWSPHFFPFANLNGIDRSDYHDMYRVAAFLNEKVRGRAFDFLDGTLGARLLRESLRREVWKLEKSTVRNSN